MRSQEKVTANFADMDHVNIVSFHCASVVTVLPFLIPLSFLFPTLPSFCFSMALLMYNAGVRPLDVLPIVEQLDANDLSDFVSQYLGSGLTRVCFMHGSLTQSSVSFHHCCKCSHMPPV